MTKAEMIEEIMTILKWLHENAMPDDIPGIAENHATSVPVSCVPPLSIEGSAGTKAVRAPLAPEALL